jgi:hypothetical protein
VADRAGWQGAVESELRALSRELDVPRAGDLTAGVRRRLEGRAVRRHLVPAPATGALRHPLGWGAVLVAVAALLAVLVAVPPGRAVVIQVLRFAGVELSQGPGPRVSPGRGGSLPGERRMSLEQARRHVSFPILVPAALGHPGDVVVSDGGRVVSLVYQRTPYGLVRMDEFAGHLDQVYFRKIVGFRDVTYVEVNGTKGLWVNGPHELVYITRNGSSAAASARLTTGNTLIWGTGQVALRLEGSFGKTTALTIASSAH